VRDRLRDGLATRRAPRLVVRTTVGALALVAPALLADRAHCHEDSRAQAVVSLDRIPARLARVKIQLQHTLGDQLLVENRTGTPLEVLDEAGVAFLRIGPAGAEANVTAPAWYETVAVDRVAIPPTAYAGATPVWTRVGIEPSWGWFDRRLRIDDDHATDGAGRAAHTTRWTIPLRFGGVPIALQGRFHAASPRAGVFTSRLTSSNEPFPGVRVRLVGGRVPALYLENGGDQPVVVLGEAGEPFLRIAPDGTSANMRSPTWQRSGKAEVTTTPPVVDAKAAPAWRTQSSTRNYAWIEFRAAPPEDEPPAAARVPMIVRRWHVPLRRGTARAVVDGEVEWVPQRRL